MSVCALCHAAGGELLFEDAVLRIVAVTDTPLHPCFCRVVWKDHVVEMTDLAGRAREHLMRAVFATEAGLREATGAIKINLASLGNLTPHLHWHVIARFADDPHFPQPVWSSARHARPVEPPPDWQGAMRRRLAAALGASAD